MPIGREETKLPRSVEDTMVYVEHPKKSTKKNPARNNKWIQQGCRI